MAPPLPNFLNRSMQILLDVWLCVSTGYGFINRWVQSLTQREIDELGYLRCTLKQPKEIFLARKSFKFVVKLPYIRQPTVIAAPLKSVEIDRESVPMAANCMLVFAPDGSGVSELIASLPVAIRARIHETKSMRCTPMEGSVIFTDDTFYFERNADVNFSVVILPSPPQWQFRVSANKPVDPLRYRDVVELRHMADVLLDTSWLASDIFEFQFVENNHFKVRLTGSGDIGMMNFDRTVEIRSLSVVSTDVELENTLEVMRSRLNALDREVEMLRCNIQHMNMPPHAPEHGREIYGTPYDSDEKEA